MDIEPSDPRARHTQVCTAAVGYRAPIAEPPFPEAVANDAVLRVRGSFGSTYSTSGTV